MEYSKITDYCNSSFQNNLKVLVDDMPDVVKEINEELSAQNCTLRMVASEGLIDPKVWAGMSAAARVFNDRYSEGYPHHRYYSSLEHVDNLEDLTNEACCKLFGVDHAFNQAPSGCDGNLIMYVAVVQKKIDEYLHNKAVGGVVPIEQDLSEQEWDELRHKCVDIKLMGLDYASGGHLSHGSLRKNIISKIFKTYSYGVNPETGLLDYDEIERQALEVKPDILLAGYSAYPGKVDFERFRKIADKCGSVLCADISHFSALVAAKIYTGKWSPIGYADLIMFTDHKQMRGPRGATILCTKEYAKYVDNATPMVVGGQMIQNLVGKLVCFRQAMKPEFKEYAERIIKNAKAMAEVFVSRGLHVLSGTTENHQILIDVSYLKMSGRTAERLLQECNISSNRNSIPNTRDKNGKPCDKFPPFKASGLRLGTNFISALGMEEKQAKEIANIISDVLVKYPEKNAENKWYIEEKYQNKVKNQVNALLTKYVPYPGLKFCGN